MRHRAAGIWTLALCAVGCLSNREQSALDPAGPSAHASRQLLTVMMPIAVIVYLTVMAAFLLIARRRTRSANSRSAERERVARRMVSMGGIVTVVILLAVLLYDLSIARTMTHASAPAAATIRLTGHQWWWEVEYEDSVAQRRVLLANEIHVPVGRPVRVELVSHDVIHSLWVPNLSGKRDLIPGHDDTLFLRADRAGRYRGQCAEFCGAEHAKMALIVVAESGEEFAAWLARQRGPADAPADSLAATGRALFEAGECAVCHTITGTPAAGRVGPNLTHVASRTTLAAGILANTPDRLTEWVRDPQRIKPGAQMPIAGMSEEQLRAIVTYLETLQ